MKNKVQMKAKQTGKIIVKKCHICGTIMADHREQQKCQCCNKSFLPSSYFAKIHAKEKSDFNDLFSHCDEIHEEDLVKGINVLW